MTIVRDCGDCIHNSVEDELGYELGLVVEGRHDPAQGGYEYNEVPQNGDNRWYLHTHWVGEGPSASHDPNWCNMYTRELEYWGAVHDDDRTELGEYYPRESNTGDSKNYTASVQAGISYGMFNVGAGLAISGDFPEGGLGHPPGIVFEESYKSNNLFSPHWKFNHPGIPEAKEEYDAGENFKGSTWVRWDTHTNMQPGNWEKIDISTRAHYRIYTSETCRRGGDWIDVTTPATDDFIWYKSV